MTTWNLKETRELVAQRFGRRQLDLARPSLQSILDRQRFAHYHYHEALSLLDQFVGEHLAESSLLEVLFGVDEEAESEFDLFITKAGAHILACVQSMHAVSDILAHAVYYSLGMNLISKPLAERSISLTHVIERLSQLPALHAVHDQINKLQTGGAFAQLSAIANHSKHRSIVRSSLSEDATGLAPERHSLKISAFEYAGVRYREVMVREFLVPEYNRCSVVVVNTGNAINAALRQNAP